VKQQERLQAERAAQAQEAAAPLPADTAISAPAAVAEAPKVEAQEPVAVAAPSLPEETAVLADGDVQVTVSSHGGTLRQVVLGRFNARPGKAGGDNPPVLLDFAAEPALALSGIAGLAPNASYQLAQSEDGKAVTLAAVTEKKLLVTRTIELLDGYRIKVSDSIKNAGDEVVVLGTNTISVGVMERGASKNEILSADSLPEAEKLKTVHWGNEKATKAYLVGDAIGGCGGPPSAVGWPEYQSIPIAGPQKWVALKSRFFVSVMSCTNAVNNGFVLKTRRDMTKNAYALESVSAQMVFPGSVLGQGEELAREYTLFIGPKKLSLLRAAGNKISDVMEFGNWFGWMCVLLVPTLNFFYGLVPNWGVAIILLTFLVRIIFWPLTHKSTVGMKKMQELQPKLKEIQEKFKNDPTKLQQETWACYRENKVNPLSSCLPMLIQIPVFIALFYVLRSAVELRNASFLWIADLSEPENLFAGMVPFVGSLNILPFLMAATMALQTYLTPTAGDPRQQRMMLIMMPIMMLVMLYGFPAALSLYWTVSQVLAIIQMLMMRRKKPGITSGNNAPPDPGEGLTRQQRRALARD
jgi:YidC/Oxa1 family membrane protein insertase